MNDSAVLGARSFHRTINVLRLVAEHSRRGIGVAEIVKLTGLARPTVYRLLDALEQERLIAQEASGAYCIGPDAYLLGLVGAERYSIQHDVDAVLTRLAERSEDTALFAVRRGNHAVFVGRHEGAYPIRTYIAEVGSRRPLGVGAASLAILSALPDQEVEEVVQGNASEMLLQFPEIPIGSIYALVDETRQQGYALNPGWKYTESWAIALPVLDDAGHCYGSLTLAGVASRIDARRPEITRMLADECRRFSEGVLSRKRTLWSFFAS